jgi:peptidoglycan-associated lipoprotein
MFNKILVISLFIVFAAGCSKKKAADEVLPDQAITTPTQDTNVQSKDINFDSQGSDSGNIAGLYSLHFEYDKSTLTSESRGLAQKNAEWLKNHPGSTVQIEGHCDQHGSIEYNLALGERRAKAAKSYMVNLGVVSKRLTTISYGKERPLDNSGSESADGKNRRANLVAQGK